MELGRTHLNPILVLKRTEPGSAHLSKEEPGLSGERLGGAGALCKLSEASGSPCPLPSSLLTPTAAVFLLDFYT